MEQWATNTDGPTGWLDYPLIQNIVDKETECT